MSPVLLTLGPNYVSFAQPLNLRRDNFYFLLGFNNATVYYNGNKDKKDEKYIKTQH